MGSESAFHPYPAEQSCNASSRNEIEQSPLVKLTTNLSSTYKKCNSALNLATEAAPRRILTKPPEPSEGNIYDNVNADLIVAVDDILTSTLGARYKVVSTLGSGTFGQVFKCVHIETGDVVAVKVIKNQPAYFHQARVEIGVLQYLNTRADPGDRYHIVRMQDFFMFRNHLCLVFELLNLNLYELIRHNKYRGLSLALVRVFISQILKALIVLRESKIIHCDIKPENVLLKNYESGDIKVIDFGSACFENRTVYSYIQSRFYRSPEVVVGHPYNMSIDMWSVGCVAAELFLGLPLFPGACEYDLLSRMVIMLGQPPDSLLVSGKHTQKYFTMTSATATTASPQSRAKTNYHLRKREEFEAFTGQVAPVGKTYFKHTRLADIIGAYPYRSGLKDEDVAREMQHRESFTDFLLGILDMNPETRWTPRQALSHPFMTGAEFRGPFQPPPETSATTPTTSAPTQGAYIRPASLPQSMGVPMSIPRNRQGTASATNSWATSSAQAAAVLATSPQIHAQAHQAAVAAVQASLRMQQHEAQPGTTYNVAHSLSRIMYTPSSSSGGAHAAPSTSYGGGGSYQMAPAILAQSLGGTFLSPPSRNFGAHMHVPTNGGSSYGGGGSGLGMALNTPDYEPVVGSHGVLPLLAPNHGTLPMSFQPSSALTYQAALAAAQSAMNSSTPSDVVQLGSSSLLAAASGGGGSGKWTSVDGNTTPQIEGQTSAVEEAVWDPLWGSDDDQQLVQKDEDEDPSELTLHPGRDGYQARAALQQAAVGTTIQQQQHQAVDLGLQLAAQQVSQLRFMQPGNVAPDIGGTSEMLWSPMRATTALTPGTQSSSGAANNTVNSTAPAETDGGPDDPANGTHKVEFQRKEGFELNE